MLCALCWVKGSDAKSVPEKVHYDPTQDVTENIAPSDEDEDETVVDQKQVDKENTTDGKQTEDDDLKEYNLDQYDDEDEVDVLESMGSLQLYYNDNREDPFLKLKEGEDDDLSDLDDFTIQPTDALIVAAHSEEDVSHLDVYVYEEEEDNLYVHHDILLPTFPLCVSWLNYNSKAEGQLGNLAAVGTFLPAIEIWNLDIIDAIEPLVVLGDNEAVAANNNNNNNNKVLSKNQKKKNKKLQQSKPDPTGSHISSVMGLSWNKQARNILASSSADKTVKVWDLSTQACVQTLYHHKDKVQAVQWHPEDPKILMSGAYDKTVAIVDVRYPEAIKGCNLSADVEGLQWNNHSPHQFFASSEDGVVVCYDARSLDNPLWTLKAHNKAVSSFSYNEAIPNYLATGSTDKTFKLWSLAEAQPKLIHTTKTSFPVFTLSFNSASPYLLAVGGKGESSKVGGSDINDRLQVFNLREKLVTPNK